jgi:hypothetical protein
MLERLSTAEVHPHPSLGSLWIRIGQGLCNSRQIWCVRCRQVQDRMPCAEAHLLSHPPTGQHWSTPSRRVEPLFSHAAMRRDKDRGGHGFNARGRPFKP